MTVTFTPKFKLPLWGNTAVDGPTAAEYNAAWEQIEQAALDQQGQQSNRPGVSASLTGAYYAISSDPDADRIGIVYRSDGSAWHAVGSRVENSITYATAANATAAIVRGAVSQTSPLIDFQDSSKNSLSHVGPDGTMYGSNVQAGPALAGAAFATASLRAAGGSGSENAFVMGARTDQAADVFQGLLSDQSVGARFTADMRLAVGQPGVGADSGAIVTLSSRSSTDTVLSVRPGASGASGDLQRWTDSSGARVAAVRPSGALSAAAGRVGPGAAGSP